MPRFSGRVIEQFLPGGEYEDERIEVVDSTKHAKRVLDHLWSIAEKKKPTAVDSEFDAHAPKGVNPIQCFSLSCAPDHKVVIPGDLLPEFAPWLEEERTPKIFQHFMADEEVMEAAGIKVRGLHADTLVLDFLADGSDRRHDLKWAVLKWLKLQMIGSFKDVFSFVPPGKTKPVPYAWKEIWKKWQAALILYSADDPEKTRRLYVHHRAKLIQSGYWNMYLAEDLPFTLSLIKMSKRGMPIDKERLQDILTTVIIEQLRAQHVFRARAKLPEMNLRSQPQLKALFFDKLRMPQLKPTKGEKERRLDSATCMDAEVLDRWSDMIQRHEKGARLAEVLLTFRQLATLRGTFLEGILNGMEANGRLYSSFNQIGATTGRISSRKYTEEYEEHYELKNGEERTRIRKRKKGANIQNIPVRTSKDPYGIRGVFVAEPGNKLIVVDMAGFEWWLMAHWSREPLMLEQNKKGYDPHGQTATRFFKLPCKLKDWKMSLPTYAELKAKFKDERNGGKTGNFGFIYGCQALKAAKLMGAASEEEGQEYLDMFFDLYPGILDYHHEQIDLARREGCVYTISGRAVQTSEILSDNNGMRAHEENRAKNAPIQGSAADIMKAIMNVCEHHKKYLRMYRPEGSQADVAKVMEAGERAEYLSRKLKARLLNQVHDELIWSAPEKFAEDALEQCRYIMENHRYSPILRVRLQAEGKFANSWQEAK